MIKKSITITNKQNDWIKAQIATGHYGNESEILRELIRERQIHEQETPAQIEAIRAKLVEAEQGGYSDMTVDQIWEETRQHKTEHA